MPAPVVGNTQLTLNDWAKRKDPDGKIARIVEMLARVNAIIDDIPFVEGNTQTGHVTTLRTGLPAIAWRSINAGVQPSKSVTKQQTFTAGLLEGMGRVDEKLVELHEDGQAFRASEVGPFMESFSQTMATTLFYGDTRVNPDRITGLSAYYANLNSSYTNNPDLVQNPSATAPDSGRNVIDASTNSEGETFGSPANGNNCSLWLIAWGENGIHGFFPKGSQAGIRHIDHGKYPVDDGRGLGATYWAWLDQYKAELGLCVRDWRQAVRICNIDAVALASAGDDNDISANLIKNAIQAVNYLQFPNMGKVAWYCNRFLKTYLEVKYLNKPNNAIKTDQLEDGSRVTTLMGYPIRRVDALLNSEAQVVAG